MKNKNEKELTVKYIESYLNFANIKKRHCFISPINKGIESKNYLISVNDKNNFRYILKVYPKSNVEEIKYETEILNKLNFGVRKKYFPIISKRIFFINEKPCILLKYIHGSILSKDDISSCLVKEIAQKQATMHRIFINYKPKHKKNRFSIFDFSFADFYLDNNKNLYYNFLYDEIIALKKESKLFAKVKFKKSIIHEDLNIENIIITKNGAINFIDFGESHKAEIISDIAIAIKE
ncbi:MAG: phosphotransferase, partial [archaeon]|nr:phosphotransferase [archaeon]